MPTYELAFLSKVLPKTELATILKRTANSIFNTGGIIRRIDNLGSRQMPYKTSNHGAVHKEANYFVLEFNAPPSKLEALQDEINRDIDIIRNRIFRTHHDEPTFECTIEEEKRAAPYRKEVVKMLDQIKRKEAKKKRFKYNTGLDYYPFQK